MNISSLFIEGKVMNIIVSLTSYPQRYSTLHICLESLFNQSMKPDLIVLYIYEKDMSLPNSVLEYEKKGLLIKVVNDDLKSHKKYFYAMQEFSNDILITVDDDIIYPVYLVEKLVTSYMQYPKAIFAGRAHGIRLNDDGSLLRYIDWEREIKYYNKPSHRLMATGVGGILYPPHCLTSEVFNKSAIKKYCLNQDDVWLKCMELLSEVPIILIEQASQHPPGIPNVYTEGLYLENKLNGGTDKALSLVLKTYSINLERIFKKYEQI